MEWTQGNYQVSSDRSRLDRTLVHHFLHTEAYWCLGIPLDTVNTAIDNSLCFGLYKRASRGTSENEQQIGFARLITDYATFGYLADVFILPEHRGQQLGRWLIQCIHAYPDIDKLRRLMLVTADAHELYRPNGYAAPTQPERIMTRHLSNPYCSTQG